MNKPLLKHSVVAVALAVGIAPFAIAQNAASEPAATVYVTGSNLKRTDKEGTQPIQTITAKEIRESGAATVTELIRLVPAMGTDNNLDTNDGGFSRGVSTASLRGLSSTSTLILLNGRRMAPSAYADPNNGNSTLYDLNQIPINALERVEILKDGASAVYGSDAIGGVINFITKSAFRGSELSVRASANDDGEFARKGATFFTGLGDVEADGYNVFFTADVSDRSRTQRDEVRDIKFDEYKRLQNRYASPYGSNISRAPLFYRESAPGSGSFTATPANAADRFRAPLDNCPAERRLTGDASMGFTATSVFFGRTFCNYDTSQNLEGTSKGKDGSFLTRGVIKLGDNVRAFAEVAYARTERQYTSSPIAISTGVTTNFTAAGVAPSYQTILPIGHPDNPFPTARASVAYRFENAPSGTETINQTGRLLTGLSGSNFNWDWETALLLNEARKEDGYNGRLHLPTLRKINQGATIASVAADPNLFRSTRSDDRSRIAQIDAKASTTFGKLPGGEIGMAIGTEFRRETLKMRPDAELAAGNIFGLANVIIDGERDVKSGFVEFRTPFYKNFEMDFAGRWDKYEGMKTNFVPKVGAKWTATSTLAFRGTYAEGFRAPALSQVTPGGAQFFLSGLFDPKRCEQDEKTPKPGASEVDCSKSASGTGGANPDLKPETSKSYSFGILFSPTTNWDFGLDFFKIRKEDEVALGSAFDALRNEDNNPGLIVRDQNPANFVLDAQGRPIPGTGPLLAVREPWINQGAMETRGVDLEASFRKNLGSMGNFSAKLVSTYVHAYYLAQEKGDPEHNIAGYNAGLVDWNLSSGLDVPRWKTNMSVSLTRGAHAFSANMNYTGEVSLRRKFDKDVTYAMPFCHYAPLVNSTTTANFPSASGAIAGYLKAFPDCAVKEWVRIGVGYTYTGIKNLSLTANIQNLFDEAAPYDPRYGAIGASGYNAGLHNPYGRYFSLSAKYSF
ncbi:TonB-dependent receptor [Massilia yuzhufengensis]|uniref:Iron complex outermembrane recepter protein n=1 Tax=Massilia yuzhufengensis TaxID=1164594 RepID=A0A1I1FX55_9BURK|nr:TonB-dependent receptor [Massilia yuzhufengensis]SFC04047.1 iron complex outermembrane recepter protein [Massilia yuzhufengensis]